MRADVPTQVRKPKSRASAHRQCGRCGSGRAYREGRRAHAGDRAEAEGGTTVGCPGTAARRCGAGARALRLSVGIAGRRVAGSCPRATRGRVAKPRARRRVAGPRARRRAGPAVLGSAGPGGCPSRMRRRLVWGITTDRTTRAWISSLHSHPSVLRARGDIRHARPRQSTSHRPLVTRWRRRCFLPRPSQSRPCDNLDR